MSEQERFGFRVRLARDWETDEPTGNWLVELPHQCDAWSIAGEELDGGVEHADAVSALERFLAEGAEALEALRAQRFYGEPDRGWWPDE